MDFDCTTFGEDIIPLPEDVCGLDNENKVECALARIDSINFEDFRSRLIDSIGNEELRQFVQNCPVPGFWSDYFDAMIPHCAPCLPDLCTEIGENLVAEVLTHVDVDSCDEVVDLSREELKQYFGEEEVFGAVYGELFNKLDQRCFQEGYAPDPWEKLHVEVQRICKKDEKPKNNTSDTRTAILGIGLLVLVLLFLGYTGYRWWKKT